MVAGELKLKTGEFVGSYMLESPPLRLKFVSTESEKLNLF